MKNRGLILIIISIILINFSIVSALTWNSARGYMERGLAQETVYNNITVFKGSFLGNSYPSSQAFVFSDKTYSARKGLILSLIGNNISWYYENYLNESLTSPFILDKVYSIYANYVYAFYKNSSLAWKFSLENNAYSLFVDTGVYVVDSKNLYSISLDGKLNWELDIKKDLLDNTQIRAVSRLVVSDSNLYFIANKKHGQDQIPVLFCINSNGTKLWSYELDSNVYYYNYPIIADYIYVDNGKDVYAFYKNSSLKWKKQVGDIENSMAYSDNLYVPSGNNIFVINSNGDIIKNFSSGYLVVSSPILDNSNNVYFVSSNRKLYSYNQNGELRWKIDNINYKTDYFNRDILSINNNQLYISEGENYTIVGDNTPPSVNFISPMSKNYDNNDSILINLNVNDNSGIKRTWIEWNDFSLNYSNPIFVNFLPNQTINMHAYTEDISGQISNASVVFSILPFTDENNQTNYNYTNQANNDTNQAFENNTQSDNSGFTSNNQTNENVTDNENNLENSISDNSNNGGNVYISDKTCISNWNCSAWGSCINGTETRICLDNKNCNLTLNKPEEQQSCNLSIVNEVNNNQSRITGNLIENISNSRGFTGRVINAINNNSFKNFFFIILAFLVVLLILFLYKKLRSSN